MIDRLDSGLRHYARIIARDLDIDVLSLEGGARRAAWVRRCMRSVVLSCVRALRLSPMRYSWLSGWRMPI